MNISELFHSSDGVHDQVDESWEFLHGFIPTPRFQIKCPQCDCENIQLSNVSYYIREDSKHPFRAEPSFKCTRCSFFWTHGIVSREEAYRKGTGNKTRRTWRWREIRQII